MARNERLETCADVVQQQVTSQSDDRDCATEVELPLKSTNPPHVKLFGGCMPLQGLRRSLSSPRNSSRSTNTTRLAQKDLSQHSSECKTDPTPAATIGAPGLWEHEGSFRWRRVRPSSIIHHTSVSGAKPSHLELRRKHTSLSDSNDLPRSLGLSGSPVTPLTEVPAVFRDPMLEELDADLPVPPPPPRAFPTWLKLALLKQRSHISNNTALLTPLGDFDDSCARHACSQTSVATTPTLTGLDKPKSCSLDHDRYGLRIYPVMQNGVKISDTHYWLLDPPQSHSARYQTGRLKCPSAENSWTPSPPYSESGDYLNVPLGVHLRREKSEPSRQALNNIHHQMAVRLSEEVPEATEAECQAVLIGTSYQYDEAVRRLKLELLCRKDYLSRSHCKRLLHSYHWDLPRAMNRARLEYESRCVRRLGRDEGSQNFIMENQLQSSPPPRTGCTLDVLQLPQSPISPVSPDSSLKQNPFSNNYTNPFVDRGEAP